MRGEALRRKWRRRDLWADAREFVLWGVLVACTTGSVLLYAAVPNGAAGDGSGLNDNTSVVTTEVAMLSKRK